MTALCMCMMWSPFAVQTAPSLSITRAFSDNIELYLYITQKLQSTNKLPKITCVGTFSWKMPPYSHMQPLNLLSLGWSLTGGLSVFDMYCIKQVEKKYYYYFLLCALAHLIPIYLLREQVITHDQRPLRVHHLTLEL